MKKTGNPVKIPRTTNYIPDEVIAAEILSRLPVKSLLKFRCVSKSWCYLISSDKDFIKSHLNKSSEEKSLIASLCVNKTKTCCRSRWMQSPLESLFKEPTRLAVEGFIYHDFKKPYRLGYVDLVGSYNGLCCLRKSISDFYLWNPATKKSHKLPHVHYGYISRMVYAGFCFDEATNDYKVLAFCQIDVVNEWLNVFKLYSFSTNCWKEVENDFPFKDFTICDSAKFLNGKLHWSVFNTRSKTGHIVSFDLESEVFGLVKPPNFKDDGSFCIRTLGVLDGSLSCVMMKSGIQGDKLVWVMKEYGIEESWHLLANFQNIDRNNLVPVHMSQEGEILFSDSYGFFVLYNLKTEKFRYLNISGSQLYAYAYVESLVSPVPVGESEMPQAQR